MNKILPPLALDVVLVVLFSALGRASHQEGVWEGLFTTAWPFLVGTAVGWLAIVTAKLDPAKLWPAGVVIWLATVLLGMLTRSSVGQGVQFSFILVATAVLGVFLLGWRLIAMLTARRKASQAPDA